MKKTFLKPIAIMAVSAFTFFSCAGTTENVDDVEVGSEVYEDDEPLEVEQDEMANEEPLSNEGLFETVEDTEGYEILELARQEEDLSTFVKLVDLSGLAPSFAVTGEFGEDITVFMPTNEAFEEMPEEEYELLIDPANQAKLILFVKRHILPSEVPLIQFNSSQIIETVVEEEIPISTDMDGNVVYVGGAQIIEPDVEASNGIIHVVDGIVEPGEFTDVTAD